MITSKAVVSIVSSQPDGDPNAGNELRRIIQANAESLSFATSMQAGQMTIGHIRHGDAANAEWVVDVMDATMRAKLAPSCLIRPEPGDLVQVFVMGSRCWLLAVLERNDPSCELVIDMGDACLQLRARQLHIVASDELAMRARSYSNRAEVIVQTASERQTHIGGTDATHAGCSMQYVERHIGMHAKNVVVTGSALLKMDAAQIHMG